MTIDQLDEWEKEGGRFVRHAPKGHGEGDEEEEEEGGVWREGKKKKKGFNPLTEEVGEDDEKNSACTHAHT